MTILTKATDKKKLLPIPTSPIAVSGKIKLIKMSRKWKQKQLFELIFHLLIIQLSQCSSFENGFYCNTRLGFYR